VARAVPSGWGVWSLLVFQICGSGCREATPGHAASVRHAAEPGASAAPPSSGAGEPSSDSIATSQPSSLQQLAASEPRAPVHTPELPVGPPCVSTSELGLSVAKAPPPQECIHDAVVAGEWLRAQRSPVAETPQGAAAPASVSKAEFGALEGKLLLFRQVRLVLGYPSSLFGCAQPFCYPNYLDQCGGFYYLPIKLRFGAKVLPLRAKLEGGPLACHELWVPTSERPPLRGIVVDNCWAGDCPSWMWARGTLIARATARGFVLEWAAPPFYFGQLG
jgi:hypothetical protein